MNTLLKNLFAALFAFAFAAADARSEVATNVWIGAENSSLEWNSGDNWSLGHKPTASEHILITNQTAQAITTSSYTMRIARLTVSGASHSLSATGFYYDAYTGEDKDSLPAGTIIEVESGRTLSIGSNGRSSADDKTIVNKLGGGTISNSGGMGSNGNTTYYRYKAINVYGGTLQMVTPNRNVHASKILIADGATFDMGGTENKLWSGCEIEVQAGGTFYCRLNNKIARLSGAGAVTGSGVLTLSLKDGPCGFAGTLNKALVFDVAEYVAGETEFVCSNATIMLNQRFGAAEGTKLADVFRVSKGLGRVAVPIDADQGHALKYDDGSRVEYARYVAAGKTYVHDAPGDDHWTDPVFGEGKIVEKSAGTWMIDSLSLTGGTFTVDAGALGTNLVLNGGVSRSLSLAPRKDYTMTFGGIDLQTPSAVRTSYGHTFVQTAGTVDASPVTSGYNSEQDEREIGYFISGGTLVSHPDHGNYSMGLGLEASGDAHVILKDGERGPHTLIHNAGGTNHCRRLRVRGNALVEVENLKFYYHLGAGAGTTGTVEIAENGVLSLGGCFGSGGDYVPNEGQTVRLELDGGTLRSDRQGSVDLPSFPTYLPDGMKVAFVRKGGACFDVPRTNRAATLTSHWTVRSDVAGGVDGGIRKAGLGLLSFAAPVSTTGPVEIREGGVVCTRSGSSALGTGAVTLRDRTNLLLDNASDAVLASGAGAQVKFSGNAVVRLTGLDVGLRLGDETGETVPFVREGRGCLTFMAGNGGGSAGSDSGNDFRRRPITLRGGALATGPCGILSAPVFGWVWGQTGDSYGHNRGAKDLRFLAYDPATGLLDIAHSATTNAIPANADGTTYAYVHNTATMNLSADAHVGALTVYGGGYRSDQAAKRIGGLSVGAGVKLTVGGGAGTVAPVIMNNLMYGTADYGPAILGGAGTLDFGAAEGLIGLNVTYSAEERRLPAKVACRVAGTGGLTVFSPLTDMPVIAKGSKAGYDAPDSVRALHLAGDNTYSGGTYVDNAIILPGRSTSFGKGMVTLPAGGQVLFADEFADEACDADFTIAGEGYPYSGSSDAYRARWGLGGAIAALKSVRLTGGIVLAGDATVRVDGADTVLEIAGGVTGAGRLTVVGTGTVKISSLVTCSGGMELSAAHVVFGQEAILSFDCTAGDASRFKFNGHTLDLGGQAVTFASVGGVGEVVNGQVTVAGEIQPGGVGAVGTLTLPGGTAFADATLVVDGNGFEGESDRLVVRGDVDTTGLAVRVADRDRMKGESFPVMFAEGRRTGTIAGDGLPRRWSVDATESEVRLNHPRTGFLLVLSDGRPSAPPREKTVVKASSFGWTPTNATACLQRALASGADVVRVDRQVTDWIVGKTLQVPSDTEVVFEDGVVVKALAGAFKKTTDSLFSLKHVTNAVLRGEGRAVLRMNKKDYLDPDLYEAGEWRHCVSTASPVNAKVQNLTLESSGGDGVYVNGAKNMLIEDIIADDHSRQGISIVAANGVTVRNCVFRNTYGALPECGIDIEPNFETTVIRDVLVEDCVFASNNCHGIAMNLSHLTDASQPVSIRFRRCQVLDNRSYGLWLNLCGGEKGSAGGTIDFEDMALSGNGSGPMEIADLIDGSALSLSFTGCRFDGRSARRGILLANCDSLNDFGVCSFGDCELHVPSDVDFATFVGATGTGIVGLTGAIDVIDENDVRTTVDLDAWRQQFKPDPELKVFVPSTCDVSGLVPRNPEATGMGAMSALHRSGFTTLQWIPANGACELNFRVSRIGSSNSKVNPTVTVCDAQGVEQEQIALDYPQDGRSCDTRCVIRSVAGGLYRLKVNPQGYGIHYQSDSPGQGTLVSSRIDFLAMRKVRMYFAVPAGAEGVKVELTTTPNEYITGSLIGPDGTVADSCTDRVVLTLLSAKFPKTAETEVWQLYGEYFLDDCEIRLGEPAVPVISFDKGRVLVPGAER